MLLKKLHLDGEEAILPLSEGMQDHLGLKDGDEEVVMDLLPNGSVVIYNPNYNPRRRTWLNALMMVFSHK